ncbi:4-hydroxythreonine-4-phosphate dehydrogenase PdxA [candidate division TA06 bacterium]|uniref:4-hydroxythreonine-4-phosphate dehydrogenase PdxA n=1 Tax=candidate division TA06 bacterium TaxID=2250710 RepID=A0A933MIV8_UNCT6|nr:4-hydroxythreonine-4-phosphate dehydrogenase PdxA [candidate division TA06 bacterium]
MKSFIAITMGDPAGIGPEIALKAAADREIIKHCRPVLVGSQDIWEQAAKAAGIKIAGLEIHDIYCKKFLPTPGKPSAQSGGIAARSIIAGALLALDNQVSALATAPISKLALRQAGYKQPGHTELLAEICGVKNFGMMFASGNIKVTLATIHQPYSQVPKTLTVAVIREKIELTQKALKNWWGIKNPRIGVLGLNPHAGEAGLFGSEEKRVILPAVRSFQRSGCAVSGPWSSELGFNLIRQGKLDALIAMYHDQGLLPLKVLGGAINITLGLPILRTSPDHGTALDIAWQNKADSGPMKKALLLAAVLGAKS